MQATLVGYLAILMWASLALLTTYVTEIPAFQLTALCFTLASLIGLLDNRRRGLPLRRLFNLPLHAWLIGIGGLFGYHLCYFLALQQAPAVEASLIAYLWPLLIVLLSALLPQERLHWFHVAGGLAGLLGAGLLITQGQRFSFESAHLVGYGFAALCALIWSGYSLASRLLQQIPSSSVTVYCLGSALLSFVCHVAFESWVWPSPQQYLAIAGLGIGPVGAAFFCWDYGSKRGNIKLLGVSAYSAPLLSTLLLVFMGQASASFYLAIACALICLGALLASLDLLGLAGKR